MGLFDFLSKKKAPQAERTLLTMKKGDIVDYYLKSWEVKSVGDYDWGNNIFSKEYELDSGDEKLFLHVTENMKCSVTKQVPIAKINSELKNRIVGTDEPQREFSYNGDIYALFESGQGYYSEEAEDASAFVSWDFTDKEEKKLISISRWGEMDIESFVGTFVEPLEFSNIIPKS